MREWLIAVSPKEIYLLNEHNGYLVAEPDFPDNGQIITNWIVLILFWIVFNYSVSRLN
jgi:hypothetical protein